MPDGHKSGCLVNDPHIKPHGPCICGYAEAAGEYLWALREAKKIAAERFGKDEVNNAPRLKEPQKLIEAAAPDLHSISSDLYRLTLVIESAVRRDDPDNHSEVLALLKRNQDSFERLIAA
jgi:hypothetical protein